MVQTPISGYGAYVNYGFEATYGAQAATRARTFGHGAKITVNRKNNMEKIYGLGSRNPLTAAAKKYEGSASVDFILSHGTFLRGVLGAVADAGGGPFTHTYTETNAIPSFTIETASELGANDEVSNLLGCKINTATLTATVGELVKVRLECPYKTETVAVAGISTQTAATEEPFTFAHGVLELPVGSTIGNVQSFELTINNTLELLWGLGSRLATNTIEKMREYTFRATVAFNDPADFISKLFGDASAPYAPLDPNTPASSATLKLTFSNLSASTALRSIVVNLVNAYIDTETLPKDVTEIIKEDVEGFALSGTSIVWTNNTAVDNVVP